MKVSEAAKKYNLTEATIRCLINSGVPIGVAFKTKETNRRPQYEVFPEKMKEFYGDYLEGKWKGVDTHE